MILCHCTCIHIIIITIAINLQHLTLHTYVCGTWNLDSMTSFNKLLTHITSGITLNNFATLMIARVNNIRGRILLTLDDSTV